MLRSPPPGFERKDSDGNELICKIVKPVYGMAQAGRRWQRSLFPWLREFGFIPSEHDPCVFFCEREMTTPSGSRSERLVLGVYVDDLAIGYLHDDEHSLYHQFTSQLKRWDVEDEGDLNDLLGVEFSNSGGVVTLRQSAYIEKMVAAHLPGGSGGVGGRSLPYDMALPQHVADALAQTDDVDPELITKYRSLVGALLYCSTNTRPDVAYTVDMLSRALGKPTPDLLEGAYRCLRYLHHTRDIGLRFEASQRPLHGYSDSDWAVKHSTSGWVFVLNQAAISWGSKKQKSVALSSCEAEIVAGSEAGKEAVHLSGLCKEFGLAGDEPVDLMMDNRSAIDVAYNPEHQGRMKHVARRHFYLRELVEEHRVRVPFVSTVDNIADFFTKPLRASMFYAMRDRIMNVPPGSGPRGGVMPNSSEDRPVQ